MVPGVKRMEFEHTRIAINYQLTISYLDDIIYFVATE